MQKSSKHPAYIYIYKDLGDVAKDSAVQKNKKQVLKWKRKKNRKND